MKNDKKGQLNIYKINNTQEQSYISLGEIDTESEISCLCASEETKNLLVGYYNGTIQIFDLVELAGSFNELKAKNTFVINNKNNRILNIGFNPSDNYFYAACYDDIMISMGQINNKTIETFPGSENNLCGFNYIDKYDHALKDFVIEMDEEGKLYIGVIDKESKSLNLLFVFTVQLPKLCFFKANFENNHIYIGDKEGNIEIMSFNISHSSEKEVDIKVEKIFNTCLSGNQQNKFSSLITGNFPYKINDIWFNPRKKEIILGLENGTVQILSHFKNFAEYIIYEDNKNKEKKSVNKLYFDKLNSILYIGGVQKNISAFEFPENYNSEICRKLQDSNSFELLNGSKICRNEIDKGYPKTTKSFRRKSLIDKLSKKK